MVPRTAMFYQLFYLATQIESVKLSYLARIILFSITHSLAHIYFHVLLSITNNSIRLSFVYRVLQSVTLFRLFNAKFILLEEQ